MTIRSSPHQNVKTRPAVAIECLARCQKIRHRLNESREAKLSLKAETDVTPQNQRANARLLASGFDECVLTSSQTIDAQTDLPVVLL